MGYSPEQLESVPDGPQDEVTAAIQGVTDTLRIGVAGLGSAASDEAPQVPPIDDVPGWQYELGQDTDMRDIVSERATRLVTTAIARFPQHNLGSGAIIADHLLAEFDMPKPSSTGIGIMELARAEHDPEHAAAVANRLHKLFGVDVEVTPIQAVGIVKQFGLVAFYYLRNTTVEALKELRAPVPHTLTGMFSLDSHTHSITHDPDEFMRIEAQVLYDYLAANPTVRQVVARAAKQKAQGYLANTRQQQQEAVRRHVERKHEQRGFVDLSQAGDADLK